MTITAVVTGVVTSVQSMMRRRAGEDSVAAITIATSRPGVAAVSAAAGSTDTVQAVVRNGYITLITDSELSI